MATVKYLVQGKQDPANIIVQLSIGRGKVFKRKSGLGISPKKWNAPLGATGMPKKSDVSSKNVGIKLEKLATSIKERLNEAESAGLTIDGPWLQQQIDNHFNKVPEKDRRLLTICIQHIIDTAHRRENAQKQTGLSERRIKGYKTFLGVIKRFEAHRKSKVHINQVNLQFSDDFKDWLYSQGYSTNYIGKNIDNLKTVCKDAEMRQIPTSDSWKLIKTMAEAKTEEEIIFLSDHEQDIIMNADIEGEALRNARKWLLFGCQIGQRGSDLLDIEESQFIYKNGVTIVPIKQKKTGKRVSVALTPRAKEAIADGFPYKISLQKFNIHIKEICKQAKINEPTPGRKRPSSKEKESTKKILPSIKGIYPKHELMGSHVCRRSFASNFYGVIPTPILIKTTGHSTERMFYKYIGKEPDDYAFEFADYVEKLQARESKEPSLTVVKSASNG